MPMGVLPLSYHSYYRSLAINNTATNGKLAIVARRAGQSKQRGEDTIERGPRPARPVERLHK
ncbi:hypothetical protein GCM10025795_52030 [Verticiella sediminum]